MGGGETALQDGSSRRSLVAAKGRGRRGPPGREGRAWPVRGLCVAEESGRPGGSGTVARGSVPARCCPGVPPRTTASLLHQQRLRPLLPSLCLRSLGTRRTYRRLLLGLRLPPQAPGARGTQTHPVLSESLGEGTRPLPDLRLRNCPFHFKRLL